MNTMYVNNTNQDIKVVMPYFHEFNKTGVLSEDVSDLFSVKTLVENGVKKIIIDFSDD